MPPPRSSSGTRWKARWATASTAGRRVQQEEPRIPGQGSLQGQLRRVDECGHRRVPRRQRADILQVFEVGTATMMYAKGAIKPVQQMSEKPATRSIPRNSSAPWPATTRRPTASWCRCRSTAPPWCSTTTRTPSRRPAWTPTSRQDLGRAGRRRPEAQGRRPGMRLHHLVAVLGPAGNVLGLAQRALRHWDNGFGGLDARVAVNTRCTCATWKTWPSWARKASSCTAVAATSRTRCSSAASAP